MVIFLAPFFQQGGVPVNLLYVYVPVIAQELAVQNDTHGLQTHI